VAELFTSAAVGRRGHLIGARVTPLSGFFVVDGRLGDPNRSCATRRGNCSGVVDVKGEAAAGSRSLLDAPGALAPLGTARRWAAAVDASASRLVAAPRAACPTDATQHHAETTIATSRAPRR